MNPATANPRHFSSIREEYSRLKLVSGTRRDSSALPSVTGHVRQKYLSLVLAYGTATLSYNISSSYRCVLAVSLSSVLSFYSNLFYRFTAARLYQMANPARIVRD
jgi:hypothetical protein